MSDSKNLPVECMVTPILTTDRSWSLETRSLILIVDGIYGIMEAVVCLKRISRTEEGSKREKQRLG